MTILRNIAAEVLGLFIDDSNLALLVAALVSALGVSPYAMPTSVPLVGLILLFGCLAILAVTTLRAHGRR